MLLWPNLYPACSRAFLHSVLTERYLDDWGDHFFHQTFTWLTQHLRLGALLHPATLRGQQHTIPQLYCQNGLAVQRRNISPVSCSGDGNCGCFSLLNANCRFLGQVPWDRCVHHHCPCIAYTTTLTLLSVSSPSVSRRELSCTYSSTVVCVIFVCAHHYRSYTAHITLSTLGPGYVHIM